MADKIYVTAEGSPVGDGSYNNPTTLDRAVTDKDLVGPGITVCLRGIDGPFKGLRNVLVSGIPENKVVFTSDRCEPAVLDIDQAWIGNADIPAALQLLRCSNVVVRDLEITNSATDRHTDKPSTELSRPGGISCGGDGIEIINCDIRDCGTGVAPWSNATNFYMYGCNVFNNGWYSTDRGHGHNIYGQNKTTEKTVSNCFVGPSISGFGFHFYGSSKAFLDNIVVTDCVIYNSRSLFGGACSSNNHLFMANTFWGGGIQFGYVYKPDWCNSGTRVIGNLFKGQCALISQAANYVHRHNIHLGIDSRSHFSVAVNYPGIDPLHYNFNQNSYFNCSKDPTGFIAWEGVKFYRLKDWRAAGKEPDSNFYNGPANGSFDAVKIKANVHDDSLLDVNFVNVARRDLIHIDLYWYDVSIGTRLRVTNVLNPAESWETIYAGRPLTVDTGKYTLARPIGCDSDLTTNSYPEFGCFRIKKLANVFSKPLSEVLTVQNSEIRKIVSYEPVKIDPPPKHEEIQ